MRLETEPVLRVKFGSRRTRAHDSSLSNKHPAIEAAIEDRATRGNPIKGGSLPAQVVKFEFGRGAKRTVIV